MIHAMPHITAVYKYYNMVLFILDCVVMASDCMGYTCNITVHGPIINSLWPSDVIWLQGSRSTLAQVMACCLTAPSHYLNQC